MPFYIMQDFAHSMRYNTNSISFKNNYRQWRETESHYNERAHHTGIQNLTLPYDWQPPPFLKDITEEEAWQVLYLDEPEASIGLYEQGLHQQLDALDGYGTYKIRVHPHFDPKKSWAVLYFRQHLVLAKKEASRIVVYNPAGNIFLPLYHRTWKTLARTFWDFYGHVDIVHLDCQGYNDCSIWVSIIPSCLTELLALPTTRTRATITNRIFDTFINV